MKSKLLFLIFYVSTIFSFTVGFAQNLEQQIDSAFYLFDHGFNDESKEIVNTLLEIDSVEKSENVAKLYFLASIFCDSENNINCSSQFTQRALLEVEGKLETELYYRIGIQLFMLLNDQGDYSNTREIGLQYLKDFKVSGIINQTIYTRILRELASSYFYLGKYDSAFVVSSEGLDNAQTIYDVSLLTSLKVQSLTKLKRFEESVDAGLDIYIKPYNLGIINEEDIVFKIFDNYIEREDIEGFEEVDSVLNNFFVRKYNEASLEKIYYLNAKRYLYHNLKEYDRLEPVLKEMKVGLNSLKSSGLSNLQYLLTTTYVDYAFYKNLKEETIYYISETTKYLKHKDSQTKYLNYYHFASILEKINEYNLANNYYDKAYLALVDMEVNEKVEENKLWVLFYKWSNLKSHYDYQYLLDRISAFDSLENQIDSKEDFVNALTVHDASSFLRLIVQSLTKLKKFDESIKAGLEIFIRPYQLGIINEEEIVFDIFDNYKIGQDLEGFDEVDSVLNNFFVNKYGDKSLEYLYYLNAKRYLYSEQDRYDLIKTVLDNMRIILNSLDPEGLDNLWYLLNRTNVDYFFYKKRKEETKYYISETAKFLKFKDSEIQYWDYQDFASLLEKMGESNLANNLYDKAYLAIEDAEQNEKVVKYKFWILKDKWSNIESHYDYQYQIQRLSALDSLETQIRKSYTDPVERISKLVFIYPSLINLNFLDRAIEMLEEIDSVSLIYEGVYGENRLTALNDLAIVLKNIGNYQESEKILKELLQTNMDLGLYNSAMYNLTNLASVSTDYKSILTIMNEFDSLMIHDSEQWEVAGYLDMKAYILTTLGEYQEAEELFKKASIMHRESNDIDNSESYYQHYLFRLLNAIGLENYNLIIEIKGNLTKLIENYQNDSGSRFLIEMLDYHIKGVLGTLTVDSFNDLFVICKSINVDSLGVGAEYRIGLLFGYATLLYHSYYYYEEYLEEVLTLIEHESGKLNLAENEAGELNSMLALIYSTKDSDKCRSYLDKIGDNGSLTFRDYLSHINYQLRNNSMDSVNYYLNIVKKNPNIPDHYGLYLTAEVYWYNKQFEELLSLYPEYVPKLFNSISSYFVNLRDKSRRTYFEQFQHLSSTLLSTIYYSSEKLTQSDLIEQYQLLFQSKGLAYNSEQTFSEIVKLSEGNQSLKYVAEYSSEMTDITNGIVTAKTKSSSAEDVFKPNFTNSEIITENLFYSKNFNLLENVIGKNDALVDIYRFLLLENVDGKIKENTPIYAFFVTSWENDSLKVKVHFKEEAEQMEDFGLRVYKAFRGGNNRNKIDDLSYNVFWNEIDSILSGIGKIYYNPDGVYNLINPNTLFSTKDSTYLVDNYSTEFVSSNFFKGIHDQSTIKYITTGVLFGDPNLNYLEGPNLINQLANVDSSRSFGPIPYANEEVEQIGNILKSNNISVQSWTGEEATETKFKELQNPGILHLATHGISYTEDNGRVFNYLFLAKDEVNEADGFVNSRSIEGVDLDDNVLTVLSACETALGEINNGDGIYGLRRSFQIAGSKNLVMSMWKVDDKVTMEFMVEFYQQLGQNHTISNSFFNTVRTIKKKYPEPYYWGAFILATN